MTSNSVHLRKLILAAMFAAIATVLATASGQSRNSAATSSGGRRKNSLFGRRTLCEPSSVVQCRIATSTSCSRWRSFRGPRIRSRQCRS